MTSKIISIVSVKAVMIAALFTGTAATSSDAHADRYHHSYGGYYHHGGYYRGHRHRYHRHRYRRHHRDRDIAYLAGGLILGGVIVDAIHRNRDHHVVRERRVIEPSYRRGSVGRHLHRDRYGNCFERTGNGDLIELPPSSCAW